MKQVESLLLEMLKSGYTVQFEPVPREKSLKMLNPDPLGSIVVRVWNDTSRESYRISGRQVELCDKSEDILLYVLESLKYSIELHELSSPKNPKS